MSGRESLVWESLFFVITVDSVDEADFAPDTWLEKVRQPVAAVIQQHNDSKTA